MFALAYCIVEKPLEAGKFLGRRHATRRLDEASEYTFNQPVMYIASEPLSKDQTRAGGVSRDGKVQSHALRFAIAIDASPKLIHGSGSYRLSETALECLTYTIY
ncbi:hypothetical protein Q7P35_005017 [Cladosporium inversicolor]